ncbi:MAG: DNA-binding response regulator [Legionellales bacterium]|nr:DNA-binding response regulator [Legionellales bacterium]|tara:strand:- start:6242 stop:6907 length:666 start_codon:yes stop_codon:yes gene_type:complete
MRLLLVEDDLDLGDVLSRGLTPLGYAVDWLKDGESANEALRNESFDLVILDLGLPKMDGLQVLENLRARGSKVPVLILTARENVEDRVKGLDEGADDYMVKPFDLDEICARIRAIHRRSSDRADPKLTYGEIIVDPAAHTVSYKGEDLNIPRREFSLLQKLLENVGRALSREALNQSLYSWDEDVDSNALEVHIHNLRKKFGSTFIRTIRGVGYMVEKEQK